MVTATQPPADPPVSWARSWHDLGGTEAGAIAPDDHDYALWEKRIDALMLLAFERGLFTVDAMRRALEQLGPGAFETMSYYERWTAALAQNLIEAGVISIDELGARMEAVGARGETYGEAQNPAVAPAADSTASGGSGGSPA
ncbi:MAG: ScnB-like protein [Pseudomonadota bacterium]